MKSTSVFLSGFVVLSLLTISSPSFSGKTENQIVSTIIKAPVRPDGNVAGAVTDILINLDTSLNPAVTGRSLLAGRTIKITLPEQFIDQQNLPIMDILSSPDCAPGNLQCSTGALLQGWPQHPILPAVPGFPPGSGEPQYLFSFEKPNTLVFTAVVDIHPGAAFAGPGIKQMHLMLYGFTNPEHPGYYPVIVNAETGPEGELETGSGLVHIIPQTRPSINVTSAFNGVRANTIYQTASPGELTPFAYDFLLWDRTGSPLEGATVEMIHPDFALIKQGKEVIGHVIISAPDGATGQEVFTEAPATIINAPISALPTARMTSFFRAGNVTGQYVMNFMLTDGNTLQMFVDVQ